MESTPSINSTSNTVRKVEDTIDSKSLTPKPNPLIGMPVNLLYLKDGDNLAGLVIKQENTGKLFTLSAESDVIAKANAIQIDNFRNFRERLQEALNYGFLVSIYYEKNRIDSLVMIKPEQNGLENPDENTARSIGGGSGCHLPPRRC